MTDLVDSNLAFQAVLAVKVLIAALLAGVVGFERELMDRPAGIRTHALLGAAAALLVGIAELLTEHFTLETSSQILRVDPIRVVEAIVTGTAFLGAGTIFRHRHDNEVEGLTTAASLLLVSAMGIAVALGQLLLAVLIAGLALGILRAVRVWTQKM